MTVSTKMSPFAKLSLSGKTLSRMFAPDFARYEDVRPVAYPLWRAGTLAGSPAEELTGVFLWTPLLVLTVPWGYVYREYVRWPRGG